jgi:AcrR family transcriptional regulator
MVSTTFKNLSDEKKHKINEALIKEFSSYPLSASKVSRIVSDAGIARGAFYKYFEDLHDAYNYIYTYAIGQIHAGFQHDPNVHYSAEDYLKSVSDFVNQVNRSEYFDLVKMHITTNEALLEHLNQEKFSEITLKAHLDANTWANAVLTHETIKLILTHPEAKEFLLKRYKDALLLLDHEEMS